MRAKSRMVCCVVGVLWLWVEVGGWCCELRPVGCAVVVP